MSEIDKDPLVKRKSELKRRIKRAREKIEDPEDSEGIEYRYPKREEIALAASVHLASVLGINIAFPSPKVLDESWNKPSNPCWPHIRERVIEKYKRLGQKVVDSSTDIDVFNFSRDLSLQVFGSEE